MNNDDLETRLGRLRPAEVSRELNRVLCAAEPPRRWVIPWLQPWPLAYAALAAVWTLIGVLRVLTPHGPEPTVAAAASPMDAPALAGTLSAERTFFLARNLSEQP